MNLVVPVSSPNSYISTVIFIKDSSPQPKLVGFHSWPRSSSLPRCHPHPSMLGTYGKSHDAQLVSHQLDNHTLLEWGGAATQDRSTVLGQLQELLFQLSLENCIQRLPINDQSNVRSHSSRVSRWHLRWCVAPTEFSGWLLWFMKPLYILQCTVEDGLTGFLQRVIQYSISKQPCALKLDFYFQ